MLNYFKKYARLGKIEFLIKYAENTWGYKEFIISDITGKALIANGFGNGNVTWTNKSLLSQGFILK